MFCDKESNMQIDPYLNFPGNCEEAFNFYAQCFGGTIDFKMTHGESPIAGQFPAEWSGKIMHISMRVGDRRLMGSDAPPQYYKTPQGLTVSITVKDPAEAERVFGALSEKGNVTMALQQTFWSLRFGMLTDRFGIPWMVNCTQEP
jgi:PhnB protein